MNALLDRLPHLYVCMAHGEMHFIWVHFCLLHYNVDPSLLHLIVPFADAVYDD